MALATPLGLCVPWRRCWYPALPWGRGGVEQSIPRGRGGVGGPPADWQRGWASRKTCRSSEVAAGAVFTTRLPQFTLKLLGHSVERSGRPARRLLPLYGRALPPQLWLPPAATQPAVTYGVMAVGSGRGSRGLFASGSTTPILLLVRGYLLALLELPTPSCPHQ